MLQGELKWHQFSDQYCQRLSERKLDLKDENRRRAIVDVYLMGKGNQYLWTFQQPENVYLAKIKDQS